MAMALLVPVRGVKATPICMWLYGLNGHCDATLIQSTNGDLVGTTVGLDLGLGPYSYGTLFQRPTNTLSLLGELTNFVTFTSGSGGGPEAGAVFGPLGKFVGTTAFHGISSTLFPTGMGGVYDITLSGMFPADSVYRFGGVLNSKGQPMDGASPRSTIAVGADNYLYGTTYEGGSNDGSDGFGALETVGLTIDAVNYSYSDVATADAPNGPLSGASPFIGGSESIPWTAIYTPRSSTGVPDASSTSLLTGIAISALGLCFKRLRKA